MPEQFVPFESVEACAKCGHERWRAGFPEMPFFALHYVAAANGTTEHFEVTCRACDYTWREAVRGAA